MSEEQRTGRLDMPLIVLEEDIKLHLNSAQASLDTLQVKYARSGLLSAAVVQAHSKLALTYAQFVDGKERQRFKEYMELAVKLVNAYWEDFGLSLLKSAHMARRWRRASNRKPNQPVRLWCSRRRPRSGRVNDPTHPTRRYAQRSSPCCVRGRSRTTRRTPTSFARWRRLMGMHGGQSSNSTTGCSARPTAAERTSTTQPKPAADGHAAGRGDRRQKSQKG